MRLSHALASMRLGFAICVNLESGMMGSPGRMSSFFLTSQSDVAPTSMYISRISSTFFLSSSRSSCGGLEPTTPTTSPLRVLMIRRWPSTTWPHHPPSGRNLTKPSLVTHFTMKPTSSRCPASMTFGHLDEVGRSEEHTSELQSRSHLVCRLLLERKKQ